jgi:MFS family permease
MKEFKPNLPLNVSVISITSMLVALDCGWGYLETYVASYLHSYSDNITTSKVHILYSIIMGSGIIGAQIFHPVCSRLGYREAMSLSLLLGATGTIICVNTTSIWGFVIPAMLWGTGVALRILTCSFFMVEIMPNNYALAAGLGNVGAALTPTFWGWVPLLITNPDNNRPDIEIREISRTSYYFGEAVTSKVPDLFLAVTIITLVASV